MYLHFGKALFTSNSPVSILMTGWNTGGLKITLCEIIIILALVRTEHNKMTEWKSTTRQNLNSSE